MVDFSNSFLCRDGNCVATDRAFRNEQGGQEMSIAETGGSAFPVNTQGANSQDSLNSESGMTLRDYFAGQALMGLCTTTSSDADFWYGKGPYSRLAADSFALADAMLAARRV